LCEWIGTLGLPPDFSIDVTLYGVGFIESFSVLTIRMIRCRTTMVIYTLVLTVIFLGM